MAPRIPPTTCRAIARGVFGAGTLPGAHPDVITQCMTDQTIRFTARLRATKRRTILQLPGAESKKLPSRGQVAVHGIINGQVFQTVLEPDGDFGHWMNVNHKLQTAAGLRAGDTATVEIAPTKEWPEPRVPPDLRKALAEAPQKIRALWDVITPMARWEWVRWVSATNNPGTRQRRVEVSISKLSGGKGRPCCFNRAACTDPDLSKNGKLVGDA